MLRRLSQVTEKLAGNIQAGAVTEGAVDPDGLAEVRRHVGRESLRHPGLSGGRGPAPATRAVPRLARCIDDC